MYLVFTRTPGESYSRLLRSLLYLCNGVEERRTGHRQRSQ